jgi:hypothetical protein
MATWWRSVSDSPRFLWSVVAALVVLDAVGLYWVFGRKVPEPVTLGALPKPAKPQAPPPPAMIHPPAVVDVLQSGTLIVISKTSQAMYVFSDGLLWGSSPVSTGKRLHTTPSGVFPILQKRKFHRSNIYSNAPMPWMQRLTWDGIALHAGRVPGYAASHGCIRMPHGFAQALFELTNASATTVVIGDEPLASEVEAQQFAMTANLPVRSALAPPLDPRLIPKPGPAAVMLAGMAATVAKKMPAKRPLPSLPPVPPALGRAPGQTIQLAAASSQAEAEAHWARLVSQQPELSRLTKTVEAATINARPVYRLRISGPDANKACARLKSEGGSCFSVS